VYRVAFIRCTNLEDDHEEVVMENAETTKTFEQQRWWMRDA
jgi:hypothetical protein